MMNLIIDIGNTRIKAAIFEHKELKHVEVFSSTHSFLSSDFPERFDIRHAIIGTVVNDVQAFVNELKKITPVILFDSQTAVPLKNLYRSAHTLGSDRLAAAVGANYIAPNENVLVIDAGTCIKYNFINAGNEYLGGGISPGLQMRFKAMNTFTSRLPLLEADKEFDELIGTDTAASMRSGAQLGAVAEVEGIIKMYTGRFNNLKVFLTGGDTDFFAKRLKMPIFADQFLILKGLNGILEYNK